MERQESGVLSSQASAFVTRASWPLRGVITIVNLITLLAFRSEKEPKSADPSSASTLDPAFRRVLMYLLVGSKGGYNRIQIIRLLRDEPMNANKLCERLGLDYKTIQHHLKILQENNVIVTSAKGAYGAMYFLTPYLERNVSVLEEIWAKFGKR